MKAKAKQDCSFSVETSDVEWPFPGECSLRFLPIQEILIEKLASHSYPHINY